MNSEQMSPNAPIHPGGDGQPTPPATTEPPTGAIGCSDGPGEAVLSVNLYFKLLDDGIAWADEASATANVWYVSTTKRDILRIAERRWPRRSFRMISAIQL